ncbi:hypothetical protein HAHE_03750 [Haloferula helveola]|uniref:Uncharacterized protein n=1 Tax=Haloferula helveola TaxID=490095 RepID=A0ABN6GYU5_9BACT|nr:hypothetical protein HAHE_03750 [Haloferula helveola]
MDDPFTPLVALVEALVALLGALVEGLFALIELLALLIELLVWGILWIVGKRRPRPSKRHLSRPKFLQRRARTLWIYLIIVLLGGTVFGGFKLWENVCTVPVVVKRESGEPIANITVEWIDDSGEPRREQLKKGRTRYTKWSWDRIRIIDSRFLEATVDLTKEPQEIVAIATTREALKEKALEKASGAAARLLRAAFDEAASAREYPVGSQEPERDE